MPPEKKFEGMFEYSSRGVETPVEAFSRIMHEIAPAAGELVLVAAGFLGKLVCERVRALGGIALDIGSAADYWMGFQTRAYGRNQTIFDPSSSLVSGQPFPDSFGRRRISDVQPCHSDLSRDTNLTGMFAPSIVRAPESLTRSFALRLVGHPRCGSGYVSQVFQRLGLLVGHERLGEHGICSWMHAVEDQSLPYAAPVAPIEAFKMVIGYVRNPFDAVPSIMLENTRSRSLDFRRFHIFRLLGTDVAKAQDPLERAVRSYLAWTSIVEVQSPTRTLRIEHMATDLSKCLPAFRAAGLAVTAEDMRAIKEIPKDVNSSIEKFPFPKPKVEAEQHRALPNDLRRELAAFCERYGYPYILN
jgi:hypothetical protein